MEAQNPLFFFPLVGVGGRQKFFLFVCLFKAGGNLFSPFPPTRIPNKIEMMMKI